VLQRRSSGTLIREAIPICACQKLFRNSTFFLNRMKRTRTHQQQYHAKNTSNEKLRPQRSLITIATSCISFSCNYTVRVMVDLSLWTLAIILSRSSLPLPSFLSRNTFVHWPVMRFSFPLNDKRLLNDVY